MCFWEAARRLLRTLALDPDKLGLELNFTLVTVRRTLYPSQPHILYRYSDDDHTGLIRLLGGFGEIVFMKY